VPFTLIIVGNGKEFILCTLKWSNMTDYKWKSGILVS